MQSDNAWDGTALTLVQNDQVTMPQTPNGSAILAWRNTATQNLGGTLALTMGGQAPQWLDAPALATQPGILAQNGGGDPLTLSNVSEDASTPIWIQMFAQGIPGAPPQPLNMGTHVLLAALQTAQGMAQPNFMQLVLQSKNAALAVVAVIGGPPDSAGNNAYLFALNYPGGTAPPGYMAVTAGNTFTFEFNWGSSSLLVVNLSAPTAGAVEVLLQLV